jgi:hypothetical protein
MNRFTRTTRQHSTSTKVAIIAIVAATIFFIISVIVFVRNTGIAINTIESLTAPPNTFLYKSTFEAWYITWVDTSGNLTGTSRDVTQGLAPDIWIEEVVTIDSNITGHIEGNTIILNSNSTNNSFSYTGTFDGHTLTLNVPQTDGHIRTFVFQPSDVQSFNDIVTALNAGSGSPNDTCSFGVQYHDARVVITGPDAKHDCKNASSNGYIIESDIPSNDSITCSGMVKLDSVTVYDSGGLYYASRICRDIIFSS